MDWKAFGKKLLFPPVWLMGILTVISGAGLVFVFVKGWEQSILAYFIFALSFYTLSVVSIFCAWVLPGRYTAIKQKIYDNPLGNRFLTDRIFRTHLSLSLSFSINILYAVLHLWSWKALASRWFLILAVYYGILAVMRYLLVRYVRIQKIGVSVLGEWKRSRICAYILLLINLSLSGAVLMILYQDKGYDYPGILIYVMALYTFYATIHALVDFIRCRRLGSPIMSTAKIVSLSSALVSMLNLETAMFAQFGKEMSQENQQLFIILTGAGVSLVVILLSVLQIVNATKAIRRAENGT